MPEEEFEDDFDEDVSGDRYCYDCGGRGWEVDCIDDLCHSSDECIHGKPPVPCRTCNPRGVKEDGYF